MDSSNFDKKIKNADIKIWLVFKPINNIHLERGIVFFIRLFLFILIIGNTIKMNLQIETLIHLLKFEYNLILVIFLENFVIVLVW